MIGLQAFMMVGGGIAGLSVSVTLLRPFGTLAALSGCPVGLIVGVLCGAAIAEIDSELTLRCGLARESQHKLRYAGWLSVSLLFWLSLISLCVACLRFLASQFRPL